MKGWIRFMAQLLKVSSNKRFLIKEDGTPFFWLGDTAWELFHKLNKEEAETYLENRANKGFNVIQAVALAEYDGIRVGNVYGQKPLLKNKLNDYDPTLPDLEAEYDYWDHLDYVVELADSLGIYIALLPTWGDKYNLKWGKGPELFNEENAKIYGEWLAQRYSSRNNIIWVMGGDRPLEEEAHYNVIRAMAEGIQAGDKQGHLMTFHPPGCNSSSTFVHDEEWLDFNMIQSGHSLQRDSYRWVEKDYNLKAIKPTFDGEPRYEDHPINFKPENGYFDDFDIRQAAYWGVFAGGFGHTYGHHSIWSMTTKPAEYYIMTWQDAINRPGGNQMQYLRKLIESRPMLERVPDQSIIARQYEGENHIQATRGMAYAFMYSPNGLPLEVKMGIISGERVKASWYNPRNGESSLLGEFTNSGTKEFNPPTHGRNNDWILVLDDAEV